MEGEQVNRLLTDLVRVTKGRAGSQEVWKTMVQLMFDLHCLSDWMERRGMAREAGWQHKTTHTDTQFATLVPIKEPQRVKKKKKVFFFF